MARNIIFESLTTDIIKSESTWQGYLSINDNKNINNDLVNAIINNDDILVSVVYEDNSEDELLITNKEVDTESALKSFNYEFDGGYIRTDSITNVAFSMSSELTPIKFVFYIEAQDTPVMLKSGGLRSGNDSSDISKIKLSNTTYNIKDTTARADILTKQDTLVSGTNIKTINNTSLLGSGDIDTSELFIAEYSTTQFEDIYNAHSAGKQIIVKDGNTTYTGKTIYNRSDGKIYIYAPNSDTGIKTFTISPGGLSTMWGSTYNDFVNVTSPRTPGKILVYDSTGQVVGSGTSLNDKQDTLVSGTNIKSINNQSLLGSGNLIIESGVSDVTVDGTSIVSSQGVAELNSNIKVFSLSTGEIGDTPSTYAEIREAYDYWEQNQDSTLIFIEGGIVTFAYDYEEDNYIIFNIGALIDENTTNIAAYKYDYTDTSTAQFEYVYIDVQPLLQSGINIKTINNTSLLGSGNIAVGGDTNVIETVKVNNTPLTPDANKAVNIDLSSYATETYVQNYVNSLDAREVEY